MAELTQLSGLDLAGLAGVAVYLLAYALLQTGFMRGQGYAYPTLTIVAAALVLAGLVHDFNLAAAVIQVSFITISLIGILRIFVIRRRSRLVAWERRLLREIGLDLPDPLARRLLDLGTWMEAEAGTVLTIEGDPVEELVVLARGRAVASVNADEVAGLEPWCLIGEISCLTRQPASATVALTEPGRIFCIEASALRRLVRRCPELGHALRATFSQHIQRKLTTQNALNRRLMAEIAAATAPEPPRAGADGQR